MAYIMHEFYCTKCGNKGIPIQRRLERNREKFHKKRLYCLHCKEVINHIECTNPIEVEEFKENFKNGVYANEEEEKSICYGRSVRCW